MDKMDTRMSEARARYNAFIRAADSKPADRESVSKAYKRLSAEFMTADFDHAMSDFDSALRRASVTGCCMPTEPGEAEFYKALFRRHPNMNTQPHHH
jgi:hypothetical protein